MTIGASYVQAAASLLLLTQTLGHLGFFPVPRRLCGRPFVLWANADAGERHEAIDCHAHIAAVMEAVRQGLLTRDTDCRCAYARDAVIFDLAPPLAQSIDVDQLANWLEGWGGPVDQKLQNSSSQWRVTLPWAWIDPREYAHEVRRGRCLVDAGDGLPRAPQWRLEDCT